MDEFGTRSLAIRDPKKGWLESWFESWVLRKKFSWLQPNDLKSDDVKYSALEHWSVEIGLLFVVILLAVVFIATCASCDVASFFKAILGV